MSSIEITPTGRREGQTNNLERVRRTVRERQAIQASCRLPDRPANALRATTSGGLAKPASPQVVVWLARKDSNLRLLIQSLYIGIRLASHLVSVEDSNLCPIPG
jgi:hypothetical protein